MRATFLAIAACLACSGNVAQDETRHETDSGAGGGTTVLDSGTVVDAGTDVDSGTDAGEPEVWTDAATGFSLLVQGGYFTLAQELFYFSLGSRLLTYCSESCFVDGNYTGGYDLLVELTAAQVEALVARLEALRFTDQLLCGNDAPEMELLLELSAGSARYESNFYAACRDAGSGIRYIDFEQLQALHSELSRLMNL